LALVAHPEALTGNKLEQLVVRFQRHSGRPKQECWRFVIQHGLKTTVDHRRWTEEEIEFVREELVKRPIEEIARKLSRTPKAVRSMLVRNHLGIREIRCDRFSMESLALALRVRTEEIRAWIAQGWLQATVSVEGKRRSYNITPEALTLLYKNHLPKILGRGLRNQALFDAYFRYCYSPKHTEGPRASRCSVVWRIACSINSRASVSSPRFATAICCASGHSTLTAARITGIIQRPCGVIPITQQRSDGEGDLIWWPTTWQANQPDQKAVSPLIKNLTANTPGYPQRRLNFLLDMFDFAVLGGSISEGLYCLLTERESVSLWRALLDSPIVPRAGAQKRLRWSPKRRSCQETSSNNS
jgi:hypothetical protein